MKTQVQDKQTGAIREVVVDIDDGVRPQTTLESLSKLKPVFTKGGSTTAGNSSQMTDGAAASVLMSRSTARKLGLKPLGVLRRFVYVYISLSLSTSTYHSFSFAVTGVPPEVQLLNPAALRSLIALCRSWALDHCSRFQRPLSRQI